MSSSTPGERITAAVSTLVAIAILGAAVAAQQSVAPRVSEIAALESDLRFQLDLAYRQDGGAYRECIAELENTLAEWRESPQSPADRKLLVEWLRTAMDASMPGSGGALPPTPAFGAERPQQVASRPVLTQPVPARPPAAPVERPAAIPELAPEPARPAALLPASPQPHTVRRAAPETVPPRRIIIASETIDTILPVRGAYDPTAAPAETSPPLPPSIEDEPSVEQEHSIAVIPTPPAVAERAEPVEPMATAPPAPIAAYGETEGGVIDQLATTPDANLDLAPVALTPEPPPVAINLAELDARIAGYQNSLAEIDAAVVARGAPTGSRLEQLITEAESLAADYQFLRLYYDALTESEREYVTAPASPVATIELLASHAAEHDEGADFLADFETASDEPTLSDRLRTISASLTDESAD